MSEHATVADRALIKSLTQLRRKMLFDIQGNVSGQRTSLNKESINQNVEILTSS